MGCLNSKVEQEAIKDTIEQGNKKADEKQKSPTKKHTRSKSDMVGKSNKLGESPSRKNQSETESEYNLNDKEEDMEYTAQEN